MRLAGGKKFSTGEWVVIFAVAVLAVAFTEFIGVAEKWENAVVYTVVVFSVVITALRPAWGRRAFWQSLALVFLFHVLAVVVIGQSLPPSSKGPRGLPLTAAAMVEGVVIASVLWKRSISNRHISG